MSVANLSPSEMVLYDSMTQNPANRSVKLIQVSDIFQAQNQGSLNFTLPGFPDTIKAEATVVDYQSTGQYFWGGQITNYQGNAAFLKSNGAILGHIQVDSFQFEIRPINVNYSALIEFGSNTGPFNCVATDSSPSTETPDCPEDEDYNTCPATLTVLLLNTAESQAELDKLIAPGWQNSFILFWTSYVTNLAFFNSDIPNKAVKVLIDPEIFPFSYHPGNDFDVDMETLKVASETKRAAYNADVVFLLTERNYTTPDGNLLGIADEIGADASQAFGLIRSKNLNTPYLFSHELGHLLGGRHFIFLDNTDDCHHAWIQEKLADPLDPNSNPVQYWRTIVGLNILGLNAPLVATLNYSNPDVFYVPIVYPTGAPDANNAIVIRNRLCEMAGFFDSNELEVAIVPVGKYCDRIFTATLSGSFAGPLWYTWRWNHSGNFITEPGTVIGSSQTVDLNSIPFAKYFIQVVVLTSNNGLFLVRQTKLNFYDCPTDGPGNTGGGNFVGNGFDPFATAEFEVFPNPSENGAFTIRIPASKTIAPESFRIFDSKGQLVWSQTGDGHLEARLKEISTDHFSTGFYTIQYRSAEQVSSQKLIIINP